jgi:hypothetical protein
MVSLWKKSNKTDHLDIAEILLNSIKHHKPNHKNLNCNWCNYYRLCVLQSSQTLKWQQNEQEFILKNQLDVLIKYGHLQWISDCCLKRSEQFLMLHANSISAIMVNMFTSSVVNRRFKPQSGQIKDYKNVSIFASVLSTQ